MAETLNKIGRRFTFVEGLIVVIVAGILSAVIVPRFTRAKDGADNRAIAATVQAIRVKIDLYKQQHDGRLPDLSSVYTYIPGNNVQHGPAVVKNGIAIGQDVSAAFVYDYGTAGEGTGRFWGVDREANGRPLLIGD